MGTGPGKAGVMILAYIDPGTGASAFGIWAAIAPALAAVFAFLLFPLRRFFRACRKWFARNNPKDGASGN